MQNERDLILTGVEKYFKFMTHNAKVDMAELLSKSAEDPLKPKWADETTVLITNMIFNFYSTNGKTLDLVADLNADLVKLNFKPADLTADATPSTFFPAYSASLAPASGTTALPIPENEDYLTSLLPNQKQFVDEVYAIFKLTNKRTDFRNATHVIMVLQDALSSSEWTDLVKKYYFYKYDKDADGQLNEDEARSFIGDYLVSMMCKGDVSDVIGMKLEDMAKFQLRNLLRK